MKITIPNDLRDIILTYVDNYETKLKYDKVVKEFKHEMIHYFRNVK